MLLYSSTNATGDCLYQNFDNIYYNSMLYVYDTFEYKFLEYKF